MPIYLACLASQGGEGKLFPSFEGGGRGRRPLLFISTEFPCNKLQSPVSFGTLLYTTAYYACTSVQYKGLAFFVSFFPRIQRSKCVIVVDFGSR